MLRSFLLLFISLLFPLLLFGQENGETEKDTTEDKDPSSYKNEVGLGVNALGFLSHIYDPALTYYTLQGNYKRSLSYFTLRAGIGFRKAYIYNSKFVPDYDEKGWSKSSGLILNIGIERSIWEIGGRFQMNFGLDLVHRNRWSQYHGEFRADGIGVTWMNSYRVAPRSSISLELGMAYGKYGWQHIKGLNWENREKGFITYRNLVLSYNYHF